MTRRDLHRVLVALIEEAEAESVRCHGASRPDMDALALDDLISGIDPRTADVLALVARMPVLFDAIGAVVGHNRLREQIAERRGRSV